MSFLGNIAKGTANSVVTQTLNAVTTMGKSAVHSLMPDDYEYYLCSFELYNSSKERKGFLSFVVMPDQIVENHNPIQTLIKTHGGIVTVFNPSFAPIDISISGTFGRKWRFVSDYQDPTKEKSGFLNLNIGSFLNTNLGVKSGYGLTKLLEKMVQTAGEVDDNGKPYFMIFNNYAFNTAYMVNIISYNFAQSYDQNMIWRYSIQMKAVGYKPQMTSSAKNLLSTVASNAISNGLTNVISGMIGL